MCCAGVSCLRIYLATLIPGVDASSKVPLCAMVLSFVHRSVPESIRTALDTQVELSSVRSTKVYERLETLHFSFEHNCIYPASARRDVLNLRISVNTHIFVLMMIPPAGLVDLFLLMVPMVS